MPAFLRLGGHPVRWQLLTELSRSDRQVRELTASVGQAQSLTSYHLKQLRDGGLVTVRRSSADGRDAYYSLDLDACRDLFIAAGGALHPGLTPVSAVPLTEPAGRAHRRPISVLFLCTGNSSRSQIAEALLQDLGGDRVEVFSAGSHPKPIHPYAVRVMRKRGLDLDDRRSKHVDEFTGRRLDHVISLCDRVREVCPDFPGPPTVAHWSIADPADEGWPAFVRTAQELETRVRFLLSVLEHAPTE